MSQTLTISPKKPRIASIRELVEAYSTAPIVRCERSDALFTATPTSLVYMNAKDPTPTQELHSREALAPVFADSTVRHDDALPWQTTILTLTRDEPQANYCMPHHLTTTMKHA